MVIGSRLGGEDTGRVAGPRGGDIGVDDGRRPSAPTPLASAGEADGASVPDIVASAGRRGRPVLCQHRAGTGGTIGEGWRRSWKVSADTAGIQGRLVRDDMTVVKGSCRSSCVVLEVMQCRATQ